jgi:lipoate-protein ligase A
MATHLATREKFKEILDQAFQKAYGEEVARRKATHDDFENVIAELKKVTSATKTIETNINEGF